MAEKKKAQGSFGAAPQAGKPGIRLVDLKRKERSVTGPIDFADGQDLTVTYDAASFTGQALLDLQAAQEASDLSGIARYLADLIVDWDVEGDGGNYPTDRESLLKLPLRFLNEVVALIMGDLENPTTGGASSGP